MTAECRRNLAAGLWGHTPGENRPPEPTSSHAPIDPRRQPAANPATTSSWTSVAATVGQGHQADRPTATFDDPLQAVDEIELWFTWSEVITLATER